MQMNGLHKLDPVYLLAPVQIMTWLNFYHRRFIELNEEFQIVSNLDLVILYILMLFVKHTYVKI